MPRQRDPRRDEAFEIWKASGGEMKLKDIAAQLGVSDTQIRKWKNLDQWEQKLKGNVTIEKRNVTNTKDTPENDDKPIEIEIDENNGLTEKQRLFCLYYVKSFNATQAAIKAGYAPESAHVEGSRLLRNAKVAAEIKRIKQEMTSGLFIEAMDVLQKYIEIAFADITDYVTFGQKEVPVIGMFGPIKDEHGRPLKEKVNYVELKDSSVVDGTIITEVKQGKDGVSIKLADKMKALEKLSLYFDLFPDNFKRKIEEEKLKIAHYKAFGPDEHEEYEDDGFLEALDGKAKEVWDDEEA
ncbi:Terminase small subunit [Parageobacillus caldoxylosilyticus]|uniref:terminase small subunit n=1 Tax=Saccharococcus caldoxylosilyticus TaxID=81408 RepID=UPI001C4E1953|nr:terminase small subunit [Parageobacillus caldoxylosilyticus]QXJ39574.1 Terminase small subunit [Parageobacillus caldoxylosilyticus]